MMSLADQLRYFQNSFGKKPTRNEIDAFAAELKRANLDVMAEALLQAAAAATRVNRPPPDIGAAVLAQYDRIVALNGQLFPVFFVFESAYRTLVATALDAYYGATDWWHPVREAVERGEGDIDTLVVGGLPLPREVVRAIARILQLHRQNLADIVTTFDLIRVSAMYDVGTLLDRHYSVFASLMNPSVAEGVPSRGAFEQLFGRVRRARNDAYHQLVVRERGKVVSAAERLLDLIDIHLGDRVGRINHVVKPDLDFPLFKELRHQ